MNRRRPSRETPLGPGAKKDGCFRRLLFRYQIDVCMVVVSGGKALDFLRDIHRGSSEGGYCQVVTSVNSLVKQFYLEFFCNGIKALAKAVVHAK